MKIAIIEDVSENRRLLAKVAKQYRWDVDFFKDSSDFGRAKLDEYDVIVADEDLPTTRGRELIQSISLKTAAQLFLMGSGFKEEDIHNERIKGLIDRGDTDNLVSQLRYIESKLRLNRIIEKEASRYGDILPSNGFSITENGDVFIVTVTSLPTASTKTRMFTEMEDRGVKKAVLAFPNERIVYSMHLGLMTQIHKFLHKRGGTMALWNITGSKEVANQMDVCNLILLFPVFDDLEEALKYLRVTEESLHF